jgi:hypothetical protein
LATDFWRPWLTWWRHVGTKMGRTTIDDPLCPHCMQQAHPQFVMLTQSVISHMLLDGTRNNQFEEIDARGGNIVPATPRSYRHMLALRTSSKVPRICYGPAWFHMHGVNVPSTFLLRSLCLKMYSIFYFVPSQAILNLTKFNLYKKVSTSTTSIS